MAKVGRASRNASLLRVEGTITGDKTIASAETGELYLIMLDAGTGSTIKGLSLVATDAQTTAISNQRVKFPDSAAVGSRISIVCDGTDWYITDAVCSVAFTTGAF